MFDCFFLIILLNVLLRLLWSCLVWMRGGFVEGVLAVMVFMLLFNVCSLVLMIYWDIVRGGLGS